MAAAKPALDPHDIGWRTPLYLGGRRHAGLRRGSQVVPGRLKEIAPTLVVDSRASFDLVVCA
jgi:hypothetical protein